MKLDYIANVNEYGDNMVRLYDFDKSESCRFKELIQEIVVTDNRDFDLSSVNFIQARNCNLILKIANEDLGIITSDNELFLCELTLNGYMQMITLLEPFCKKETNGYQWLYDVDSQIDFLFSPGGTW